jgi:hypothetical protein
MKAKLFLIAHLLFMRAGRGRLSRVFRGLGRRQSSTAAEFKPGPPAPLTFFSQAAGTGGESPRRCGEPKAAGRAGHASGSCDILAGTFARAPAHSPENAGE